MKKIIGIILAIITVVTCVFAFAGCSSIKDPSPAGIKEYGSLVIATNATFPPFEYQDENGNIVGWDMDIAAEFAKKLGVELVIENMKFDSVLIAPGKGKAHIAMAGISRSDERDEYLDFTQGVFDSSQVIIVKEDSTITGPMDLAGKVIGVQQATVGQLLGEMDADWAYYKNDKGETVAALGEPKDVKPFSTGAAAVADLVQGKVDAVIIDKFPAQKFVESNPGTKILEETVLDDTYAFAVKEGNKELVDWLNAAIDAMKADGTLDAINKKYFG